MTRLAMRSALLTYQWRAGQMRLCEAPMRSELADADHWARYEWLYARGGQCDLADLGVMW